MQGRPRILVIEDDPMFRNLVVSLLRADYLVAVASDGKSGYAKAQGHRPDLVIIDYQMPGWNGIETLWEFRQNQTFEGTKFIMLTGDASKETVVSAIQAGTDDYVIKSTFNRDLFARKVGKLLAPTIVKAVVPRRAQWPAANSSGAAPQAMPTGGEAGVATAPSPAPQAAAPAPPAPTPPAPKSADDLAAEAIMDDWE